MTLKRLIRSSLNSALLVSIFSAPASWALDQDFQQRIVVDAGRQQVNLKDNRVTFFDKVTVTQGSIKMQADKLSVIGSEKKGSEVMVAIGKPTTFSQKLENGSLLKAQANEIRYELATRTLTLSGKAQLSQAESQVKGEVIRYSIEKQEMVAEGGENSRVTTIFLPQQLNELEDELNGKDNN